MGLPAIKGPLSASLAEEEVSNSILAQIARELMSQSNTGIARRGRELSQTSNVEE